MNNHDVLHDEKDPLSAVTASVKDALRLGCVAVGFTIYPGSANAQAMYQQCREMIAEAKADGLAAVVWSYPRGTSLSKDGETALDVVAYAAQIAAQLGAHVIKVKPPTAHIEQAEAKKAYEKAGVPIEHAGRARAPRGAVGLRRQAHRHLLGRGHQGERRGLCRRVPRASATAAASARSSAATRFQRQREHALAFLGTVMKIYSGELK